LKAKAKYLKNSILEKFSIFLTSQSMMDLLLELLGNMMDGTFYDSKALANKDLVPANKDKK